MSRLASPRIALLIAALFSTALAAQEPPAVASSGFELPESTARSLKEAAQLAVLKSPEVLSRWHAFREAEEEVGVAR